MKRKKEEGGGILPVLLGMVTAASVAVALIFFNLDAILMRVAPKVYISAILASTMKEIGDENERIDAVYPKYKSVQDSNSLSLTGEIREKSLDIDSEYNADTGLLYAKGDYDGTAFEGYIDGDETGICLPDMMDVYFTLPAKTFGETYNSSPAKGLFPFEVSSNLDLSLDALKETKSLDVSDFYAPISSMLDGVKAKKGDEKDEILITLQTQSFKDGMNELMEVLRDSGKGAIAERLFGTDIADSLIDAAQEGLNNMKTADTITLSCIKDDGHFVKMHTLIKLDDGSADILIDGSQSERMLDNYAFGFNYETDSAKISAAYESEGNHFYDDEPLSDTDNFSLDFGNVRLLDMKKSESGDRTNRSGAISLDSSLGEEQSISISYSAVLDDDTNTIDISDIAVNDTDWGSAKIVVSDYAGSEVPQRKKYPLADLDVQDYLELGKLLFGGIIGD